jgi:hypothetical protein
MKNHHHHSPIHPHSSVASVPDHAAIAEQAYHLWEEHGHPENRDEAIWLEAESQLLADQSRAQTHRA